MRVHRRTFGAPRDTPIYYVKFTEALTPGQEADAILADLLSDGTFYDQTDDTIVVLDVFDANTYAIDDYCQAIYNGTVDKFIPIGGSGGGASFKRAKPDSALEPGGSEVASVYEWDGGAWVDSGDNITIYDPMFMNCIYTDEFCSVPLNAESGRYELIGSQGLLRRAEATSTITAGSTGSADFDDKPGATLQFSSTVHLNHIHGSENISSGKLIFCQYLTDEQKWVVLGADCEDP